MIKTSYVIAIGIAVAAAAWVLSGQIASHDTVTEAEAKAEADALPEAVVPRVRVREQHAEPRALEIILRGKTEASRMVVVRAETRSKVIDIAAEKGAYVQSGDVLVSLSDDDRQAKLQQAKALLAQREIEFDSSMKLSKKGYRAETQVADAKAKLEEAKAAVTSTEIDIAYTTIRAPFNGIVEKRAVEEGDFVNVGDEVATVVDLDPVLVVGQVAEQNIEQVKPGMPGTARLVTGATVTGTVRYVAATADEQTRTFRVELEVPNHDRSIVQGVSSELRLPVADVPAYYVSPAILTLAENGDVGVKTLGADGKVEFHTAKIIAGGEDGVWLAGLPETVTFITVGQDFVMVGQRVEAVPDEAAPAGDKPAS
ncbi:MAG TPA: efflux RND transporter periplasmic adaptor subunit [Dongiaceae bacterium]|jgi:multidrug efflux system membrane fusion protein|nr:efflux RND transporter periplasmic adaptor subunit [Dongiaceae bacterium]